MEKLAVAYGKSSLESYVVKREKGSIRLLKSRKIPEDRLEKWLKKVEKNLGVKRTYVGRMASPS